MTAYKHFRVERSDRGVATVTVDVQDSAVNVFSEEVVGELADILASLEQNAPKLAVFRSGKPSGFFAGADIKQIQKMKTPADADMMLRAGQDLFGRVERLPCPTVAVIHGVCLGGGLEFALSCRFRVARDDSKTKLGLPEVMLGIIPGWGGTQRLPRLVGLRQGLRMILEGSTVSASKAAKIGLADLAPKPETFDSDLARFLDERLAGTPIERPGKGIVGAILEGTGAGRSVVMAIAKRKLGLRGKHYPALTAAMRAVAVGLKRGLSEGLAAEREEFSKLIVGPVAPNLIDLFFRREQARKASTWVSGEHAPRKIKKATVVGAGTMGAGIAQLLAFNGIPVVLKDINDAIAQGGKKKVETLTADAVKKGIVSAAEAEAVVRNVTATADWGPLADCDLAIEAVIEREDVKRDVFHQLAEKLGPDAVLASNTSALSITRLAEGVAQSGRVAGLHFFNPVHKMQLVEVVRGSDSNDATIATLVDLVRKTGKVPVVVADSSGFLVNRILFPYLDEAVRLVLEGIPGGSSTARPSASACRWVRWNCWTRWGSMSPRTWRPRWGNCGVIWGRPPSAWPRWRRKARTA